MSKSYATEAHPNPNSWCEQSDAEDVSLISAGPHQVEQEVKRRLLSSPDLRFSSLVIRRIDRGVCLEGVLEIEGDSPDVCSLAQKVAGVEQVLNHLVMRQPRRARTDEESV